MTRQLSGLISTVTAAPVVRFLSLSSIRPSERHRRCCSQRFFPELAEVSLVEHFSIRISRDRPDFERITVAAIEKPVRGSDGLLLLSNMCIIVDRSVRYNTYPASFLGCAVSYARARTRFPDPSRARNGHSPRRPRRRTERSRRDTRPTARP